MEAMEIIHPLNSMLQNLSAGDDKNDAW